MKKIGVLALQGDFSKHIAAVTAAGASGKEVREAADLDGIDGLLIPGGESTTMGKLLERYAMLDPLRRMAEEGLPVFGTCAGAILLARNITGSMQTRLGLMDMEILRNGYGRQIDSFEADIPCPELGEIPLRGVFIRAPVIKMVGKGVTVLAEYEGIPVFVRQGNLLACTFHPELTADPRIHTYFLSLREGA